MRWRGLILAVGLVALGLPQAIHASVPTLKISPLKYQSHLALGKPQQGYVDVSNPTDGPIHITVEVQAFRQTDKAGTLEFYDEPRLANAITPDYTEFDLQPRQSIHLRFTIDPNKLGEGGAYGTLLFRTTPPPFTDVGTAITPAVRVGTLLILDVGNGGTHKGSLNQLQLPWVSFGQNLSGSFQYKNIGSGPKAVGYNPKLKMAIGWFAKPVTSNGPLILPGSTRSIDFSFNGSHLGLIPVTVSDADHYAPRIVGWTVACTGIWQIIIPLLIVGLALGWWVVRRIRRSARFGPQQ